MPSPKRTGTSASLRTRVPGGKSRQARRNARGSSGHAATSNRPSQLAPLSEKYALSAGNQAALLGDYARARQLFTQAAEIDPGGADAIAGMGVAAFSAGDVRAGARRSRTCARDRSRFEDGARALSAISTRDGSSSEGRDRRSVDGRDGDRNRRVRARSESTRCVRENVDVIELSEPTPGSMAIRPPRLLGSSLLPAAAYASVRCRRAAQPPRERFRARSRFRSS